MAVFNLAAGHGAGDPGAVNGARKEKDDNLRISLAVEAELKKRGHTVRQYRSDDSKNCDWKSCRSWLDKNSADFSIVFHRNAFNGTATGVEVWSFNADTKSTQIAADMSAAIASASGLYNRGRKGNGAAWISANVNCCEPEIGFVTNVSDNEKFDSKFNSIVNAVCDTLENHFGKGTASNDVIAIGTTTNYLNIRKAPVTGTVLTSMPTGSKCDIYSIENGWAKVSYGDYEGYSSTDYMTIEYIVKEEVPKVEETPKEEVNQLYRVRKSWDDASSQVGAYSVLANAIEKAEANKCNVYDTDGSLVWEYTDKSEPAETPAMEENKSSENDSNGPASEDNSNKEVIPETEETPKLPEESEPKAEGTSLDDTVPAFIKFLKKIVDIILSLWRKA